MKIFLLADYYPKYLDAFYATHKVEELSHAQHQAILMNEYFGGFVSYYNHFRKLGHEASLVIGNDTLLQKKWLAEHGIGGVGLSKYDVVLRQVEEFKPDIFFMGSMFDYYGRFLEKVSHITRNIFGWIACPFSDSLDFSNITCVISSVDDYAELFRKKGLKTEVLRAAFDGDIVSFLDDKKTIDVSFVGGLSKKIHSRRVRGLEYLLREGTDLKVFGYGLQRSVLPFLGSPLRKVYGGERWGIDMYRTLNSSKISLNFHIDVAQGFSGNMRMFEATGCGSLLMTENTPDLKDKFIPGREVVAYDNFDDLVEKIRYYLAHEDEASKIAKAGQKACLETHGYDKRIVAFEEILLRHSA